MLKLKKQSLQNRILIVKKEDNVTSEEIPELAYEVEINHENENGTYHIETVHGLTGEETETVLEGDDATMFELETEIKKMLTVRTELKDSKERIQRLKDIIYYLRLEAN